MTTGYLQRLFSDPQAIVPFMQDLVPLDDVDVLIGTGLSGVAAVAYLGARFDKRFVAVRKDDDRSNHSDRRVEGDLRPGDRWLFVDDFMASGTTYYAVLNAVHRLCAEAVHVGAFFYTPGCDSIEVFKSWDKEMRRRLATHGPVPFGPVPFPDVKVTGSFI